MWIPRGNLLPVHDYIISPDGINVLVGVDKGMCPRHASFNANCMFNLLLAGWKRMHTLNLAMMYLHEYWRYEYYELWHHCTQQTLLRAVVQKFIFVSPIFVEIHHR